MGIAVDYIRALETERQSRAVLEEAVGVLNKVTERYSIEGYNAEREAKRVLDDPNNGLSSSEEVEFQDRIRNAPKFALCFAGDKKC